MGEPIEVVQLAEFDPDGEPQVRVMADGSLYVVFEFMPPSWAEDTPERFVDFDRQLSAATSVSVEWNDREFFHIQQPAPDTIERVRKFLASYPR